MTVNHRFRLLHLTHALKDAELVAAMVRLPDPWFQAHIDRSSDYGHTVMVHAAERDDEIVGLAMVDHLPKAAILVDPAFRRTGIGSELLRRVISFHGPVHVTPRDQRGLAFFERLATELRLKIDRSVLEAV